MDPLTQGTVGALAAQLGSKSQQRLCAALLGALGGMAPDLDTLIRSGSDPLLVLEFHRQFTHSLFFIPVIGVFTGLVAYRLLGRRWQFTAWQAVLWCSLGCATHGLLDGCTSYGTQLLWPFSSHRFAWDIISIIDPLFTLPLLAVVILAARGKSSRWVVAAVAWLTLYLGFGLVQHERAVSAGEELALQRGHYPLRIEAKPSFANLIVWKVIYETEDKFFVDAVKVGVGDSFVWEGDAIEKLDITEAFSWLQDSYQQRRDILRFDHFSAGYIALDPKNPLRVVDIRYSLLPQQIDPLWGIELSRKKSASEHVEFFTERSNSRQALNTLLGMIFLNPDAIR